ARSVLMTGSPSPVSDLPYSVTFPVNAAEVAVCGDGPTPQSGTLMWIFWPGRAEPGVTRMVCADAGRAPALSAAATIGTAASRVRRMRSSSRTRELHQVSDPGSTTTVAVAAPVAAFGPGITPP